MHLLAATPGAIDDGSDAVDLGQNPGDVVFLSFADTELSALSDAYAKMEGEKPSLRLANLSFLKHPMSVDLYVEQVLSQAKLVVIRLLGGRAYWDYGVEQVTIACGAKDIPVAWLPGDDQPDAELDRASTVAPEHRHRLWQYLVHGGPSNVTQFLNLCSELVGISQEWSEPAPLPPAGLYPDGVQADQTVDAVVVFYRALMQAGNTAPVDALLDGLKAQGMNPLALFVTSLKDPVAADVTTDVLTRCMPNVILNATGFAVASPDQAKDSPLNAPDCPVLQVVFATNSREAWADSANGLSARDIAMAVALPEVDGRLLTRAVAFKGVARRDDATECDVVRTEPEPERIAFVSALAANWARLRTTPAKDRRIALITANYPTRDGRLGNGVGLDTPAAVVQIMCDLNNVGYAFEKAPETSDLLMDILSAGPTNALKGRAAKAGGEILTLDAYRAFFASLPPGSRAEVLARWGAPEADPHFVEGEGFRLSLHRFGNAVVGVQPARGYHIDPTESYHDPDLIPPHGYLAFYAWLRQEFGAQAIVHVGKHGNMEWLPGKSVALSARCWPEAVFGPTPHLYPFIVNDPGEGTQAKRRAQAVIIDHLTPPLTRAESYGPLKDLEALADEYYEAAGVDPRRCKVLREEILSLVRVLDLDKDLGIVPGDDEDTSLAKLDAHLCELKELQIRDGLHIFGVSPAGDQRTDLLVALARVPRGSKPHEVSLHRALAADLGLDFDPLDCDMAAPWAGARPAILQALTTDRWRTAGDTVERLELYARDVVAQTHVHGPQCEAAGPVLNWLHHVLAPTLDSCGAKELAALRTGLDGRFVRPGPSGAPTRGRADVLPTGKNFFSVDTRTVPTPAAWTLGWHSATLLIERHAQEHGDWPRAVLLTAWGTANMRTGGDDIAQGLALMGVKPVWDAASRRVTGFEVMPASVLGRPRVDVTLRVSGFFRDAFPSLIDLFDSAVRAVAAEDEPDDLNPIRARVRDEAAKLTAKGMDTAEAERHAAYRVFGAKPGAYGAGLQALIDEKGWETADDLARAYVAWGGWAYGGGAGGAAAHGSFEARLGATEAVIQNQDNREHDLLDSDDYYQFEGGATAAVKTYSGQSPAVYHSDHSRPESPKIRTLDEEIARVVRARAANPKWIAGVMRHGYKGAFEMAATVDYLFAFSATTDAVKDHHFQQLFDAYLADDEVRDFIADKNPAALTEMAQRFDEAITRGLWQPKRNSTPALLAELLRRD